MLACVAAAASAALAACSTIPPAATAAARTAAGWLGVLPSDSFVYAVFDLKTSRPAFAGVLRQAGVQERTVRSFLDRTSRVYLALQLPHAAAPGAGPSAPGADPLRLPAGASYSALAIGRFPQGATNLSLGCSGEWKRRRSLDGLQYWQHRRQPLQVSAAEENLVLLSSAEVLSMARWVDGAHPLALPPQAAAEMESAAFAVYLPAIPPAAATAFSARLPVRDAWMSGRPAGGAVAGNAFACTAVLGLREVRNPKLVEVLFRTLLTVWLRGARLDNLPERLKAVRVAGTPESLRITGLVLTLEEMARLLQAFPAAGSAPPVPAEGGDG